MSVSLSFPPVSLHTYPPTINQRWFIPFQSALKNEYIVFCISLILFPDVILNSSHAGSLFGYATIYFTDFPTVGILIVSSLTQITLQQTFLHVNICVRVSGHFAELVQLL